MIRLLKELKKIPVFPLLIAIYPILKFYFNNIREAYLSSVLVPLLAIIILLVLLLTIFKLIYKDWYKSSLFTASFLIIFFSYGHIKNLIGEIDFIFSYFKVGEDKILFGIFSFLLIIIFFCIGKINNTYKSISDYFNVFSKILMIGLLINLLIYSLNGGTLSINREEKFNTKLKLQSSVDTNKPDIYYLIFDRYAANDTLKDYYNFDNSYFTDYLEKKGFYIAYNSRNNYPRTTYSLASSLNLNYLDKFIKEDGDRSSELSTIFPILSNNEVGRFLQSRGYRYYHIGSWYEATQKSSIADENLHFNNSSLPLDEFSTKILNTTMFSPITSGIFKLDERNQHNKNIIYQFNKLKELSLYPGPKYVFAHILLPHTPYIYDQYCNYSQNISDISWNDQYINQLKCVNRQISDVVENILSNFVNPPVIIIQADEAANVLQYPTTDDYDFKQGGDQFIKERTRILNSYYLPDNDGNPFYSDITPVNTFRLLFNKYFHTNFDKLPDKTYVFDNQEAALKFLFKDINNTIDYR